MYGLYLFVPYWVCFLLHIGHPGYMIMGLCSSRITTPSDGLYVLLQLVHVNVISIRRKLFFVYCIFHCEHCSFYESVVERTPFVFFMFEIFESLLCLFNYLSTVHIFGFTLSVYYSQDNSSRYCMLFVLCF